MNWNLTRERKRVSNGARPRKKVLQPSTFGEFSNPKASRIEKHLSTSSLRTCEVERRDQSSSRSYRKKNSQIVGYSDVKTSKVCQRGWSRYPGSGSATIRPVLHKEERSICRSCTRKLRIRSERDRGFGGSTSGRGIRGGGPWV